MSRIPPYLCRHSVQPGPLPSEFMSPKNKFIVNIERTILRQLKSKNVGYLVGAGASYFNGNGYPLAFNIWEQIKDMISEQERREIQEKLDLEGTEGLEHALDLLDPGDPQPTSHRMMVTSAIADLFSGITPPIENHSKFIRRISNRDESFVPIFTLNYDPLFELASDEERILLVDGFSGFYKASFNPNNFDLVPSKYQNDHRGRVLRGNTGILHLYKLHGSVRWFHVNGFPIRVSIDKFEGDGWRRLMIPPQHRKAAETTTQPYSALWTRYRMWLVHGPRALNRLVCIGYGMKDQHVNDVIESATSRNDFTLLIFAKSLPDDVFEHWANKENVVIVTSRRCSLFSEIGPGHNNLWDFEALCKEV